MSAGKEVITVEVAPLDEADEKLYAFIQDLQKESLKTIEDGARQIIALSTTLLGLFFGVLAFKDNPIFLRLTIIKLLGAVSAGAFLSGLFFALDVVMPRPIKIPRHGLTEMRQTLEGLYQRKNGALRMSLIGFGTGTLALLMIILWLLLFVK